MNLRVGSKILQKGYESEVFKHKVQISRGENVLGVETIVKAAYLKFIDRSRSRKEVMIINSLAFPV